MLSTTQHRCPYKTSLTSAPATSSEVRYTRSSQPVFSFPCACSASQSGKCFTLKSAQTVGTQLTKVRSPLPWSTACQYLYEFALSVPF